MCSAVNGFAQGQNSCFDAQEIILPVNKNSLLPRIVTKIPIDHSEFDVNVVYYQEDDQFSFWYKLTIVEDCDLSFQVASTNDRDDYDFLLYRYNGDNFCDTLKYKPLKAVSVNSYYTSAKDNEILEDGNLASYQAAFRAKAGDTYYLTVLSLTKDDCGHKLFVKTGDQKMTVSAVHRPCFAFNQPEKEYTVITANPSEDVSVSGLVKDQKTDQEIAALVEITDQETGEVITLNSSAAEGYEVKLKRSHPYRLKCSAPGYEDIDGVIEFYNPTIYNFNLPKLREGTNWVLENIYFHPNTFAFKEGASKDLETLFDFLKKNDNVNVEIQGHTAANTPVRQVRPQYNGRSEEWTFTGSAKKLSKMRAIAVKNYLVDKGIAEDRIATKGYGAENMRYKNPRSQTERSKNMRVEVQITEVGN